jgi:hypothetical protein
MQQAGETQAHQVLNSLEAVALWERSPQTVRDTMKGLRAPHICYGCLTQIVYSQSMVDLLAVHTKGGMHAWEDSTATY